MEDVTKKTLTIKKEFKDNPLLVVVSNLVIFALIYFILTSVFQISMVMLGGVIAALLLMERKGYLGSLFAAYNKHKKVAFLSALILAFLLPFSLADQRYIAHICIIACLYGMVGLGLNFQMGSTDMVNFAPAAFMGIGAYSMAVVTTKLTLSPWLGMGVAIIMSVGMGLVIGLPTLRTKSYYLSLVTMALQLTFTMLLYNIPYLGGPNGISGIAPLSIGGFSLLESYTIFGIKLAPQIPYLILCIGILILFAYIAMRVYISRIGLSLNLISQDEVSAGCMGVNLSRQKLLAFIIGAIFCGVAGALYASYMSYAGPEDFNFSKSLMFICMVILGGMDNVIGVITGAFILTVIMEKLRVFSDFQQLVYGIVLVTILIIRPAGLIPKRVRNYCQSFGRKIRGPSKEQEKKKD